MKILLTDHAKRRMRERKVSFSEIRRAITKPSITLPSVDGKRKRVMVNIGKKMLDVIYVPHRNSVLIVTVAWLRNEDRKV